MSNYFKRVGDGIQVRQVQLLRGNYLENYKELRTVRMHNVIVSNETSIQVRPGFLGEVKWADLLVQRGIIKADQLIVPELDQALAEGNLLAELPANGFNMRGMRGQSVIPNDQDVRSALIGRLATEKSSVFHSKYGDNHEKVIALIEALARLDKKSFNAIKSELGDMVIDFSGLHLGNIDLGGLDLRGISLRYARLPGAIFHESTQLTNTDLRNADTWEAEFNSPLRSIVNRGPNHGQQDLHWLLKQAGAILKD